MYGSCTEESNLTLNVSEEEQRSTTIDISRTGPSKKKKCNVDMSSEILSTVQDYFKQPKPPIVC